MFRGLGAALLTAASLATPAMAQITASNLLEARVGRDPDAARFTPPGLQPSASRFSLFE